MNQNPWSGAEDEDTSLEPSPLTKRIIEQSPRRAAHRYGYGWYVQLRRDTEAQNEQFVRESGRHVPLHSTPRVESQRQAPFDRALDFIMLPEEQQRFLRARPLAPLWEHQERGVAFMKYREEETAEGGGAIIYDMRTGKTRLYLERTLNHAQDRVQAGLPRYGEPTLVVVPTQSIDTLLKEIEDFLGPVETRPLNIVVIAPGHAPPVATLQHLLGTYDVIVTTYNTLITALGKSHHPGSVLFNIQYCRIVADEAHLFCNRQTLHFRAMMALQARARWFVTATPIRNSLKDLYSMFAFLRVPLPALGSPEFTTELHRLMIRQRAQDFHPIHEEVVTIDFATPVERQVYELVLAKTRRKLQRSGAPADERQKLEIILRLRQSCSCPHVMSTALTRLFPDRFLVNPERLSAAGFLQDAMAEFAFTGGKNTVCERDPRRVLLTTLPPDDRKRLYRKLIPPLTTKKRVIMDYYEKHIEKSDEKMVIFSPWSGYLQDLDALFALRSRLLKCDPPHIMVHGKVDDRLPLFNRFRTDPTCKVLLLTFGTGGVSLDLTCANHVIIPDPLFNPFAEGQALARLYGFNQKRPVSITRLVISGTIDEKILGLARTKTHMADILDQVDITVEEEEADEVPVTEEIVSSILISWIMQERQVDAGLKRGRE